MLEFIYREVDGTCYRTDTPASLVEVLEHAMKSRTRVVITYFEELGRPQSGYVKRTTGLNKVPILVYNSRSHGGFCILEYGIVEIRTSRGKKLLWKCPEE